MIAFAAYTAAKTYHALQWSRQPPEIARFRGQSLTLSNRWFLRATRVRSPNGISIGSAVLQGSPDCPTDSHTNRQTDHATYDIFAVHAMRPKTKFSPNSPLQWKMKSDITERTLTPAYRPSLPGGSDDI